MFYSDDYLQSKVKNAADLLHDGKYNEARKVIDAIYNMLGLKNIIDKTFPEPVSLSTLINLLTIRANIYLSYREYKTADSMLTITDFLAQGWQFPPQVRVKIMLLKSNVMVMPNPVVHSLGSVVKY